MWKARSLTSQRGSKLLDHTGACLPADGARLLFLTVLCRFAECSARENTMTDTLVFSKKEEEKEETEVRRSSSPPSLSANVGFFWILGLTGYWMGVLYIFYKLTDYLLGR
jgi:hypothetical protein